MKDLFSLSKKKVLITGSAQGIGFLLAKGLSEFGAEIIINDKASGGAGRPPQRQIHRWG